MNLKQAQAKLSPPLTGSDQPDELSLAEQSHRRARARMLLAQARRWGNVQAFGYPNRRVTGSREMGYQVYDLPVRPMPAYGIERYVL